MTDHILCRSDHQLLARARLHQHDPALEPIADAMDSGDTETWTKAHPILQDRAGTYRSFRRAHPDALSGRHRLGLGWCSRRPLVTPLPWPTGAGTWSMSSRNVPR